MEGVGDGDGEGEVTLRNWAIGRAGIWILRCVVLAREGAWIRRETGSNEKKTIGWAKDWKRVGEGGSVWTMDRYLRFDVAGQFDKCINKESK